MTWLLLAYQQNRVAHARTSARMDVLVLRSNLLTNKTELYIKSRLKLNIVQSMIINLRVYQNSITICLPKRTILGLKANRTSLPTIQFCRSSIATKRIVWVVAYQREYLRKLCPVLVKQFASSEHLRIQIGTKIICPYMRTIFIFLSLLKHIWAYIFCKYLK